MKHLASRSAAALAVLVALAVVFSAGCSTEGNANPEVLWLDLDGSEIKVRLVEHEPIPF